MTLLRADKAGLLVDVTHLVGLVRKLQPDGNDPYLIAQIEATASLINAKLLAPTAELPSFLTSLHPK